MNKTDSIPKKAVAVPDLTQKQANRALVALIVIFTLLGSFLGYYKYSCFSHSTGDTALVGYAFNQTLHGRFFPLFTRDGVSLMGNHPNFLWFVWLPVFWLVPTMYCLFFFQSLLISLTAWPFYLLARRVTGNQWTALIAAAGGLLFPTVITGNVAEIHEDQFALFFVVFAVYFFEVGDFKKFAIFLALSLLPKETVFLNTVAFGLYALVRWRGWKWVVFPIAWSTAYLLLMVKVLMPRWGILGAQIYSQALYFQQYGNTPSEVLQTLILHPGVTWDTLTSPDRMVYMISLLQPLLLVLAFGNRAWVLVLPNLAVNLLSSNTALRVIPWHYGVILGGMLWASYILSLPNWSKWLQRWFGGGDYTRSLCVLTFFLCLTNYQLWLLPNEYQRSPGHAAQCEAVERIPRDATVVCPDNFSAHLANRAAIQSLAALVYNKRDLNVLFDYEYMIFDGNFIGHDYMMRKQLFDYIAKNPAYQMIYSRDNVFIFHRSGVPERNLRS